MLQDPQDPARGGPVVWTARDALANLDEERASELRRDARARRGPHLG